MKTVSYVCPKHSDIVLYKDSQPENLIVKAKSLIMTTFANFFGDIIPGVRNIFIVGPDTGPFKCKKCKKYYFKWECDKHED